MHARTGQPPSAVARHLDSRGLLQSFIGEQPAGYVGQSGELRLRSTAQHHRLDKHSRVAAEAGTDRRDVVDTAAVDKRIVTDLGECRTAGAAGQVGDVVRAESQDGLTPVIMRL